MARKSKFNIGFMKINKMSIPELEEYIKKAKPYTERKVKGLATSKFSDFSDVVQYVQQEAKRAGLYGADNRIGQALTNPIDYNHDPTKATQILLEGSKTPDQLRRTARFINYISAVNEQPSQMAKQYIATAKDIETILGSWGYDDAAKAFGELASTKKGLNNLRAWWTAYQDDVFAMIGSGDGEEDLDIRYYVDTYGEDTQQFYIELFKRINELGIYK